MKQNKAKIIGVLSILMVIILVLLIVIGVTKYIITNNETNNNITNNKVSNIEEDTNSLNKQQKKLNNLPKDYNMQDAISDGCFIIANNNTIYNKKALDNFIESLNVKAEKRQDSKLRIVQFTTEGDIIITDIEYN